ncbi:substrate-binding domain-containing protein [Saccharothrix sp. BKS2]|uniref:substrate-binding domain-containing protein n=1 Tax=Saccharothrix sp. BKS2 TaxID=3064400 RepID=UPI0039EBCAAA
MGTPQHALHRTVLVVDVSGFSRRSRNRQEEVRRGLYEALETAFDECGLDWSATHHEDRGDGVLVLIPPSVPKSRVVRTLPHALAGELRRHNASRAEDARIRLRVAVTAGEVRHDAHGVVGDEVNLAFRLLESAPLREALDRTPGVVALMVSRRFFEDVVRDDPATDPDAYRRVEVVVKEFRGAAWVTAPGGGAPAPSPRRRTSHRRKRGRPKRAVPALVVLVLALTTTDAFAAVPVEVPPCPAPVQLNVLTSAEKERVITSLAVDFEKGSREFTPHGCKGVGVQVTTGTSAREAADALSRGWQDGDHVGQGTEPHVWLPDASFEVDDVDRALDPGARIALDRRASVARSPVVLGASAALAERIEEDDREFRWQGVAQVALAAPDTSSGAGLAAAAALAHAELGTLRLDAGDVPLRLRGTTRRVTDAPPCAGDVALVASEKTVADDEDCRLLYPRGAGVVLDHPFVVVERTDLPTNERRRRVVRRFEEHLRSDGAQAAMRRAGFRDANGTPGLVGDPRSRPPAEVVGVPDGQALRRAWEAAARPAVVALAADEAGAGLVASLEGLLTPRDRLVRLPLTAGVLEEAVRAGARVAVLAAAGPVPPAERGTSGPLRVVAVGLAEGACAPATALAGAARAHGGPCEEVAGREGPQIALEGVARGIWGGQT